MIMKVNKRQLKNFIRKVILEAVPDPSWKRTGPEEWELPEPPEDQGDYDAGYQDGVDGVPPAENATLAYDAGYDDGVGDATLEEQDDGDSTRSWMHRQITEPF